MNRVPRVVVMVSPEYNGAFSPLLENTIDWVSRVNRAALAHLRVGLASASPGEGGGRRGLGLVASWLTNMGVAVCAEMLMVSRAELRIDSTMSGVDEGRLGRFAAVMFATAAP